MFSLRLLTLLLLFLFFFFFNDTPPPEIYTLSLHDALPISARVDRGSVGTGHRRRPRDRHAQLSALPPAARCSLRPDRKSTRLNSSHQIISYAVFCLKKKKKKKKQKKN